MIAPTTAEVERSVIAAERGHERGCDCACDCCQYLLETTALPLCLERDQLRCQFRDELLKLRDKARKVRAEYAIEFGRVVDAGPFYECLEEMLDALGAKGGKLPIAYDEHGQGHARYIGPLVHLQGMTALVYDEHPYRNTEGGAPSVGPDEVAVQFDQIAWRKWSVHEARLGHLSPDLRKHAEVPISDEESGIMEGPNEGPLSCCWHVFPAKDWEAVR